MNGSTTMNATCPPHAIRKVLPKEIAIRMYKKVQIGPNTHEGGDRDGFLRWAYRVEVFMIFCCDQNKITMMIRY